jgi:hypothetical protein
LSEFLYVDSRFDFGHFFGVHFRGNSTIEDAIFVLSSALNVTQSLIKVLDEQNPVLLEGADIQARSARQHRPFTVRIVSPIVWFRYRAAKPPDFVVRFDELVTCDHARVLIGPLCRMQDYDLIRLKFDNRIVDDSENLTHLESSAALPFEVVLLTSFSFTAGGDVVRIPLGSHDTLTYAADRIARLTGRCVGSMVGRYRFRPGFLLTRGEQVLKMDCPMKKIDPDHPIAISFTNGHNVVFRDREGILETFFAD